MIPKPELIRAIMMLNETFGFEQFPPLPPEQKPTKQYPRLDTSDYVKPVNGYQVKQRKRKAMRKGVR